MAYIPEPTPFCLPPVGAPLIQTVAIYSHWAALVLSGGAAVATLARCKKKGVASHVVMGLGLGLGAGAVVVGENLYNNFIYQESASPATSTGLFLLAAGAGLAAAGVTMVPGFKPKRFGWLKFALPVLPALGLVLAGVGNLPAIGSGAGVAMGAVGGALAAVAGVLLLVDKAGTATNPQERLGASSGFAFFALGVLAAIGAALTRTGGDGVDKGTLAIAIGEACFSLFMLMGVLAVAGKPSDFPKPVKVKKAAPATATAASVPPPPPGGGLPPPPPSVVQPPQPPRPQPPRPPVAPPPRKPGA